MNSNMPKKTSHQVGTASHDMLLKMDESVNRKGEINQLVADKTSALSASFEKQAKLRIVIRELTDNIGQIPEEPNYDEKRQRLTAKLEQAQQEYNQAEIDQKTLNSEISRLQTVDLPACMTSICAEDVTEHHRRIAQAQSVINSIQKVINTQNKFIEDTTAAIPQAVNRQTERHSIMADIAMGNATEDDLKELDSLIDQDKNTVAAAKNKAEPLIANAKATLSGLSQKLVEAKNALAEIKSKSDDVSHRYFMGEAEKVATQYINLAQQIKVLHLRLLALNKASLNYDKRGFVIPGAGEINIPMFMLSPFDGLGRTHSHDWTLLNGARITNDRVMRATKDEYSQFDSLK